MHVVVVAPQDRPRETGLLVQMHKLRTRVFRDRLAWDVKVVAGQERDCFDLLQATYILVVENGMVLGSIRVLPALGPTMIGTTFTSMVANGGYHPHSRMLETSRFCVDTQACAGMADGGVNKATILLVVGVLEWAIATGHSEIVTVTDVGVERLLKRLGLTFARLSAPSIIGGVRAVAGIVPVRQADIERLRSSQKGQGIDARPHAA